ncbi:hypothetical protein [Streptomyces sp. NPDC088725]|uniref:hypothetical protein n=1 Tax=Streptomyces sp. NPDC088725 TaxID=3365873 RepID=UPI003807250B
MTPSATASPPAREDEETEEPEDEPDNQSDEAEDLPAPSEFTSEAPTAPPSEDVAGGRTQARPAAESVVRPTPVLTLGAAIMGLGLVLGFIGLRLRRR